MSDYVFKCPKCNFILTPNQKKIRKPDQECPRCSTSLCEFEKFFYDNPDDLKKKMGEIRENKRRKAMMKESEILEIINEWKKSKADLIELAKLPGDQISKDWIQYSINTQAAFIRDLKRIAGLKEDL